MDKKILSQSLIDFYSSIKLKLHFPAATISFFEAFIYVIGVFSYLWFYSFTEEGDGYLLMIPFFGMPIRAALSSLFLKKTFKNKKIFANPSLPFYLLLRSDYLSLFISFLITFLIGFSLVFINPKVSSDFFNWTGSKGGESIINLGNIIIWLCSMSLLSEKEGIKESFIVDYFLTWIKYFYAPLMAIGITIFAISKLIG